MGTRFRGQFRRKGGDSVAGHLVITPTGELELELWDATDPHADLVNQPTSFEGELVDGPEPGARVVTLLGCLQRQSSWSLGGSTETWIVQRALFGADVAQPDEAFTTVAFRLDGLTEFISTPPITATDPQRQVRSQVAIDGWRIELGLTTSVFQSRDELRYRQVSFARVTLERALTLPALLSETQGVFELLLSIAGGGHARVSRTEVWSSQPERSFVVWTPTEQEAPPKTLDPVFQLAHHHDPVLLFRAARGLCAQRSGFAAHYLTLLRSPSRLLDDRVRGGLNCLALLLVDQEVEPPIELSVPSELRDLLPPSSTLALPAKLKTLLTRPTLAGLRHSDGNAFIREVTQGYHWVNFHSGEVVSGLALFNLNQRLKALIHLQVMMRLGFEEGPALTRIRSRWLTLPEP